MIYALINDLIFRSKVKEGAAGQVRFITSLEDLHSVLSSSTEQNPVLLVDLHAKSVDPFDLISLARNMQAAANIVCFYSHVQAELAERAMQAGANQAIPRSRFDALLKTLVSSQSGPNGSSV